MKSLFFRSIFPALVVQVLVFQSDISCAFRNLGVPVREAVPWGAYVGPGRTGQRDTIYVSFGQFNAPLFLLAVNPDTGETKQFNGPLPSEMGSWGFTVDHENRIYLGSYYHAHLLRFDPETGQWEDLGRPGGERESFICSLTTARDGKIWGGTYPSATLFSYDPKTGETENFGRMDPDQFYCYPTAGEDGLIYCVIQFQKSDIVVFNPETKTATSLMPATSRKPGRINLTKGRDREIYGKLSTESQWFRIEQGTRLVPVLQSEIPFPERGLPDGRQFHLVDNRALRIQNPVTKETREISFKYEPEGSCIFVLSPGPDGRIYGSSMLPLRLFVYNPKNRALLNLGKAAHSNGEIYSMGSLDGKLYLFSYPEARLSVYDPKKPLQFGDREESNPRDLGPMGEGLYRPRTTLADPHGKIFVGGYPDYGILGGAIGVYEPGKDERRTYRHVIENQSIASMAYVKRLDLIAAGGSVRGGTGTRAVEKEAKLILWDPKEEKKVHEVIPVPGAKTILSLVSTEGGRLYGITDTEKVFIFDAAKRKVRKLFDLGFKDPIDISLLPGPDGKIYGLSREALFAIDPKDDQVSRLASSPVPITSGMALLGRKIYFGSDANLWEFEIPFEPLPVPDH